VVRIYLDACCISRLTDDQSQLRVREEAEAIERILRQVRRGSLEWITSEALDDEVGRIPSMERRIEAQTLLSFASARIEIDDKIIHRAGVLNQLGYGLYDALHISAAESASVDVLLSTDDRLIQRAMRGVGLPRILIQNPVSWR
jgi:predicted nucleic acid-binding protein